MTKASKFDPVESVVKDIRAGKMVIVTDDEDRENEGDFVMAAEKVTPEAVNFMAKHGRGLICAPITHTRAEKLGLQRMVLENRESQRTDFTVSVDAAEGITTGISAADRARTIQVLCDSEAVPTDLLQPGHVFPLQAKPGGVLRRAGHTEAAVDLARLAGYSESGVICEILHEDGTMARLPDLMRLKRKHRMKICTIQDLIAYRRTREFLVKREQVIQLPTIYGTFTLFMYRSLVEDAHHLALVMGEISPRQSTLVRVHSECLTGDVFGSLRCDCGSQLHAALAQIAKAGTGVLVYMRQEGRGIGLPAKIHAYKLQEEGLDTVEANEKLGYPAELRDYGMGAQILSDLGVRRMRFMTNNPKKVVGLEAHGLKMAELVPLKIDPNPFNQRYLDTKRVKLGHTL